jgi:hypothetical protein
MSPEPQVLVYILLKRNFSKPIENSIGSNMVIGNNMVIISDEIIASRTWSIKGINIPFTGLKPLHLGYFLFGLYFLACLKFCYSYIFKLNNKNDL